MAQKTQTRLCINLDGWDGKGDGREVQKGGASCIPMTDSCSGLTENKILSSNYPSLKKKKKKICATSRVVPWLGICLQCRGLGFDPWSKRIPHDEGQLSPGATTPEACEPRP